MTLSPSSRPSIYLRDYLLATPISHGLWRAIECELYAQQEFTHPVLDIGCGDGLFASILWRRRPGIAPLSAGIDLSVSQARM